MSKKLIQVVGANVEWVQAKVYRDSEWNEYVVWLYIGAVRQTESDYHTTDKEDAIDTANSMVARGIEQVRAA
jgi:hypothetical protein